MLVEHVSMELDRITRDWEIAPDIYLSSVPAEGQSELDELLEELDNETDKM